MTALVVLLVVLLLGELGEAVRQRLPPHTDPPVGTVPGWPAHARWTALDEQQLARFARDCSP